MFQEIVGEDLEILKEIKSEPTYHYADNQQNGCIRSAVAVFLYRNLMRTLRYQIPYTVRKFIFSIPRNFILEFCIKYV